MSEDQKTIQQVARKFARNEIIPVAAHHDRTGEYPIDIVKKAWEIGLLNLYIPADYGGAGLDSVTGCLISEEMAYACAGMATLLMVTDVAVQFETRGFIPKILNFDFLRDTANATCNRWYYGTKAKISWTFSGRTFSGSILCYRTISWFRCQR